jgi:hypothetical protein
MINWYYDCMTAGKKIFNNTHPVPLSITIGSLSAIFRFTPVTQRLPMADRNETNNWVANISATQEVVQCR